MKLLIRNWNSGKYDSIIIDFDSKVKINTGKMKSLSDLYTLKDIEREVRDYLGVTHWRTQILPGVEVTTVNTGDDVEFNRIKTIVKRDNIIDKLLKND